MGAVPGRSTQSLAVMKSVLALIVGVAIFAAGVHLATPRMNWPIPAAAVLGGIVALGPSLAQIWATRHTRSTPWQISHLWWPGAVIAIFLLLGLSIEVVS
jgi:hypothetical protein